jgi:hypothetical protein
VARYVAVRKIPILPKAPDLINRQRSAIDRENDMKARIEAAIVEIRALKPFVAC